MRFACLSIFAVALASAATTSQKVTFYKDVLPVLQKNCQTCHRPGEAAPMSLLTYDEARPWAKSIKQAVVTKKMPPWFADAHFGKFSNDRTLAQADVDTLVNWVDAGAPAGNAKDAPKPIDWVQGWRIGKPDVVLTMQQAFNVAASGTMDYQYFVIPTGFTEDKYVEMAEARPGDPAVVHHIIAFIREPGNPWLRNLKPGVAFDAKEAMEEAQRQAQAHPQQGQRRGGGEGGGGGFGGDFLAGYAPGTLPDIAKPGQARLVPAGSDIILQMHYTANGKASTDISKVGIVFSKTRPTERILTLAATTANFAIPAGDSNYQVETKLQLQDDATLVNLLPHMHFRGKDFTYKVTYPSGETETLLAVPHYDFNWQLTYELTQPKLLPKGTVIDCIAHYDNSANNKFNPDPTKEVHYGEQTWEEMMFGFFDVSVPLNKTAMDLMMPKKGPATAQRGAGF
ncbi:MAG: thiol-disulfide isomerase [Acidobacteriia bacterium]|nr:thiol-disulfide isomerase [Terriglobia bacterium]